MFFALFDCTGTEAAVRRSQEDVSGTVSVILCASLVQFYHRLSAYFGFMIIVVWSFVKVLTSFVEVIRKFIEV